MKFDTKKLKALIDKSELCDVAWQGIDSGGDLTTEDGAKKANRLRDKLVNLLQYNIDKIVIR